MVQDHRGEYLLLWAAVESIAPKIGCAPQTLYEWVLKREVVTGQRDDAQGYSQGNGRLTLKWEDLTGGGDKVFNDIVITATGFQHACTTPATVFSYTDPATMLTVTP